MSETPNLNDLLALEEALLSGVTEPVPSGMTSRVKRLMMAKMEVRRVEAELATLRSTISTMREENERLRAEVARLQASYDSSVREAEEFNRGHECASYAEAADIGEFASMGYAWRHFDALRTRLSRVEPVVAAARKWAEDEEEADALFDAIERYEEELDPLPTSTPAPRTEGQDAT